MGFTLAELQSTKENGDFHGFLTSQHILFPPSIWLFFFLDKNARRMTKWLEICLGPWIEIWEREIHAVKFVWKSPMFFLLWKKRCVTINGHLFRWCMWVLDGWGRRRHYAIPTQIRGDAISTKYIIIPVNSIFISIIIILKPLNKKKFIFILPACLHGRMWVSCMF